MARARRHTRFPLAAAALGVLVAFPPAASAGQGGQAPAQPPPGQGTVVVEQVENGAAFGAEFKYTEMNRRDAFLLGGYAGAIFDNTLLVGGAGYWQVNGGDLSYGGYYQYDGHGHYYGANGYGGLLLEWYALRAPAVAVSVRGLVGGGVATVSLPGFGYPAPYVQGDRHGPVYPPAGGYYLYDQGYFVFEPQANVTLRIARGLAVVGGVGYRVIGAANGFEDRIQGLTGTFAIRFGGGK